MHVGHTHRTQTSVPGISGPNSLTAIQHVSKILEPCKVPGKGCNDRAVSGLWLYSSPALAKRLKPLRSGRSKEADGQ
jgi:hypothetical protein